MSFSKIRLRFNEKLYRDLFVYRYLDEYERVLQTPEVLKLMSQFEDLNNNLTKLTKKPLNRPLDYYFLYHTFIAESSLGLPLPEWVYNYFPKGQLFDAIVASYDISSKTNLLRKYFAGKKHLDFFNQEIRHEEILFLQIIASQISKSFARISRYLN